MEDVMQAQKALMGDSEAGYKLMLHGKSVNENWKTLKSLLIDQDTEMLKLALRCLPKNQMQRLLNGRGGAFEIIGRHSLLESLKVLQKLQYAPAEQTLERMAADPKVDVQLIDSLTDESSDFNRLAKAAIRSQQISRFLFFVAKRDLDVTRHSFLKAAVAVSAVEITRFLLNSKADPIREDKQLLFKAITSKTNSYTLAKLLLAHNADPNSCDLEGRPLLFLALRNGKLTRLFLFKGARPNDLDTMGRTALHHLVTRSPKGKIDLNLLHSLIAAGGNLNQKDIKGMTVLDLYLRKWKVLPIDVLSFFKRYGARASTRSYAIAAVLNNLS